MYKIRKAMDDQIDTLDFSVDNDTFLGNKSGTQENFTSILLNATNSSTEVTSYKMNVWADLAWTTIFSLMITGAIGGNLVVFWIVVAHRRMHNVTNYFLVNLSLSDLILSCLNAGFNFIYMKNRNWIFGSVYCTINNFIAYISVAVSVFTLMAISIDRYIAIVRPLRPRMTKTFARASLVVIWLSSALLALPALLYSDVLKFSADNTTACILVWPDGLPAVSRQDYAYNIIFFALTYLVPIIAMGICYGRIGSVLWGKGIMRENACLDLAQQRKLKSKRKVVKMFIIVVVIFAVCWLPYHVYFIYTYHDNTIMQKSYIQHVYLGFYWLAMANSMFNPFVYYWMNARFRAYFLSLLVSIRRALCNPRRFFLRSDSKTSLDIGGVHKRQDVNQIEFKQLSRNGSSRAPLENQRRKPHSALGLVGMNYSNFSESQQQQQQLMMMGHEQAESSSSTKGREGLRCCRSFLSQEPSVLIHDLTVMVHGASTCVGNVYSECQSLPAGTGDPSSPGLVFSFGKRSRNVSSDQHFAAAGPDNRQQAKPMKASNSDDALLRVSVPFRNNPVLRKCANRHRLDI